MMTFDRALEMVLSSARQLGSESVAIADAGNRILAEDVSSDTDIPPFNKSAMDGYACRRRDLGNELVVVETIPAGLPAQKSIGPNQCAKIMTGSMVPEGADCVIMKEFVETPSENTVRFVGENTDDNICLKGQDVKAGEIVLRKGTLMKPQHIAVLASVGHVEILVAKRPRVAVIATGDELVEPAARPGPSQIRGSNSFQLAAQVENMGALATNCGIVKDSMRDMDSLFKQALEENDVVITCGGVSRGDYDLVKGVLKDNGVKLLFERVAVNPGRPVVFGVYGHVFCFGLPGNPVSAFVMFELLVRPFLYKMMGHDFQAPVTHVRLQETIARNSTERDSWLPVRLTQAGKVATIEYHGSAHINALCEADGLFCIPAGVAEIKEDTYVAVRQI